MFKSIFLKSILGGVIESLGQRKGEMLDMVNNGNGQVRLDVHGTCTWIDRLFNRIHDP